LPVLSVGSGETLVAPGEAPVAPDGPIRAALAKPVALEFHGTPLDEVARTLAAVAGIAVVVDEKALEGMAVPLDKPVTFHHGPMPLQTALDVMLEPLGLTWSVDGDLLWITTPEIASETLATKFYDVSDLISRGGPIGDDRGPNFDPLIETLEQCIDPDSWADIGAGQGQISELSVEGRDLLAVSNIWKLHQEVEYVLGDLRALCRRPMPGMLFGQEGRGRMQRFEPMRRALAQSVYVSPGQVALPEVARFLERALGVPIALDEKALENVSVSLDAPITLHQSFMRAPAALDAVLAGAVDAVGSPVEVTWVPYRGVIWITATDVEETYQEAEVFDIHDLPGWRYEGGKRWFDDDALIDKIEASIEPDSWSETGAGQGEIECYAEADGLAALCVSNTWKIRRQVEAMLGTMAVSPR
jgi:hypothetical protein